MARIDLTTTAFGLHRIDVDRRPTSPQEAAALIDLVVSSQERDPHPDMDQTMLNALKTVRTYVLKASQ
ncbi:hypothetical protein [Brevundimonas sp.]|uniref:hypothetical protein n=1 Tax=Brevundimonas sp. TaxID=1871086 RepID=UPI0028A13132|nr:hypothetical protein [Brevundimonas sp.]